MEAIEQRKKIREILQHYYGECGITHISVARIIQERLLLPPAEEELPLAKSPYKPDDQDDEICCDIGEMRESLFNEGAKAQRHLDYESMKGE